MQKKSVTCFNQGMSRDLGISQLSEQKANFAFENHNIRITAINDNTLYTVTNEKGTKDTDIVLEGTFLGSCNINKYIVVFTTSSEKDFIYRLSVEDNYITSYLLYEGDLNFDVNNPIDAIGYYESEEVQKVYWVDGLNTNRFINVANNSNGQPPAYNSENIYQFDFQGHINTIPTVTIVKNYDKVGSFQAGTIQYFATYYNKYGVETCIVWQSDLQYISLPDRGANPDEAVNCVFDFTIDNVDTSYQYMRIYATYRAGLNSNAEGRLVTELQINDSTKLTFSDQGLYQNYNAEDIFYIGGQNIIASTLDYKQDTLFLGDIKTNETSSYKDDVESLQNFFNGTMEDKEYENITIKECPHIKWEYKQVSDNTIVELNNYYLQIKSSQADIAGFKYREFYRFGIQLMSQRGEWTEPIWVGDKYCNLHPKNNNNIEGEQIPIGITYYLSDNVTKYFAPFVKVYTGNNPEFPIDGYYILTRQYADSGGYYFAKYRHSPWSTAQNEEYDQTESIEFRDNLDILTDNDGYPIIPTQDNYIVQYSIEQPQLIGGYFIANAVFTPPPYLIQDIYNRGYTQYRLLVAETSNLTRRILTQGVINPTMFNFKQRENNQPYAINSWIFRPRRSKLAHSHYDSIPVQSSNYAEIQGIMKKEVPGYNNNPDTSTEKDYDAFALIFAPNYLAGCRIVYKLIYYNKNSVEKINTADYITKNIDGTYTSDILKDVVYDEDNNEIPVLDFIDLYGENGIEYTNEDSLLLKTKLNQYLKDGKDPIKYNISDYKVISDGFINETTWKAAVSKMISKITEDLKANNQEVVFSPQMIPSGDQMKEAWKEGSGTEVWTYLGLAVALAASIVASIFSFGAATPSIAATAGTIAGALATLAYNAAAGACVLAAIGSAAAIGAIADNQKYNENASDTDKVLAQKGIYNILPDHKLPSRQRGATYANNFLKLLFQDYEENGHSMFKMGAGLDQIGSDSNFYALGGVLTLESEKEKTKDRKQASYYIDESLVTLNTPDIEQIKTILDNSNAYRLDLVGTIPIEAVDNQYLMYAEQGLTNYAQTLKGLNKSAPFGSKDIEGMVNGYLYQDTVWPKETDGFTYSKSLTIGVQAAVQAYKVFMWNRNTSWSLWMPDIKIIDPLSNTDDPTYITEAPAKPIKKIFANWRYSSGTNYKTTPYNMQTDAMSVYDSEQPTLSNIVHLGKDVFYTGNVDTVIIPPSNYTLIAGTDKQNEEFYRYDTEEQKDIVGGSCKDPINIRYKTTPHIVIPLSLNNGNITLLPSIGKESIPTLNDFYPDDLKNLSKQDMSYYDIPYVKIITKTDERWDILGGGLTHDDSTITNTPSIPVDGGVIKKSGGEQDYYDIQYANDIVRGIPKLAFTRKVLTSITDNWKEETSPYLFLGEIVKKEFNYDDWYGGTSKYALQQIKWNICSFSTDISNKIDKTWGDTYYQRWDCLKTYPYTEEETNSNVEVLSFMLESHINLDGRSDINRGYNNLLNLRPSNTNIFNNVYDQADNFFTYKILDDKFKKSEFGNQVVWSLSKSPLDNIDKWTSISAVNTLQLDGKLGKINKVINVNNTLLAFQDKGISTINYNLQSALTTYEGVPLQMGNTGKVTGYTLVTDNIGCLNKGAMVLSNAGLFFIDDYNNSLIQYTANEGLQNLSNNKLFSTWFKDNIIYTPWNPTNNAFRLNYDSLTQDLYIQNKTTCLVYNVQLDAFTSFMSYTNTPLLFNINGKSIALNQEEHQLKVWELFAGDYDNIYNTVVPYSIEYRINPSSNTDNMFTNYQYAADLLNEETNQLITGPQNCFDTVEAWNEYQHGILNIQNTKFNNPKFRIWRGDIPRDGDTTTNKKLKADRMRNPWIHLKLSKNNPTGEKMIFHNLNIIYYN